MRTTYLRACARGIIGSHVRENKVRVRIKQLYTRAGGFLWPAIKSEPAWQWEARSYEFLNCNSSSCDITEPYTTAAVVRLSTERMQTTRLNCHSKRLRSKTSACSVTLLVPGSQGKDTVPMSPPKTIPLCLYPSIFASEPFNGV